MFHANLITPYKETAIHGPNYSRPPPDLVDGEEEFEVEQILDMKQMGRGRKTHYLVKWRGYPTSDNSWEPEKNLNADELITKFRRSYRPKKTKAKKVFIRAGRVTRPDSSPLISTTHPLLLTRMSSTSAVSAIPSRPATPVIFRLPQLAIRTEPMPENSEDSMTEVNRYRKDIRTARALRDLEDEIRARQHKISQEREVVEKALKESMRRLEQAGAYEELNHCIRSATSSSLSPHATPFIPRRNGPVEMPILAGEEDPTQRQVVSRSPKSRRSKKCSKCGSRKHKSRQCSLGLAHITSTLGQQKMTLAERLALMDKPDWAPALCKRCFRHNPGHMELDCPQYEQCQRCYCHGSRGFVRRHACGVQAEEDEDMDFDVDEEVYQGRE